MPLHCHLAADKKNICDALISTVVELKVTTENGQRKMEETGNK